ncbi:protachykinin-1-like [Rana temporaria]|uniref:protachykinin-1-like n=1 Tax=Rana temporaria TaxID=8407 RepID=UPI001AACD618|nr:protachykinin-1-like [Rana temporaria]
MNLVVACLVFFLSATQLLAEDMEWTESNFWPESELNQVDLDEPIYRYRLRFARKPKPDQFYGTMGKRTAGDVEFKRSSPKRHKLDSFVGLMGKRSLRSDWQESSNEMDFIRRRR